MDKVTEIRKLGNKRPSPRPEIIKMFKCRFPGGQVALNLIEIFRLVCTSFGLSFSKSFELPPKTISIFCFFSLTTSITFTRALRLGNSMPNAWDKMAKAIK